MDILLIVGSSLVGIVCLILADSTYSSTNKYDKSIFKYSSRILLLCMFLFAWVLIASIMHVPIKRITYHPILSKNGVTYFFDENSKPIVMEGTWKDIADPKTNIIKIVNIPSEWKYGILISGRRTIDLIYKESFYNIQSIE